MNGKASFQKSMRKVRSAQSKPSNPRTGSYLEIGSWRFEEDEDGNLVIINTETNNVVTLVNK